ncbi:MAG: M14 family murein peptide amidase A [Magnetococcus sp. DMHC-6]
MKYILLLLFIFQFIQTPILADPAPGPLLSVDAAAQAIIEEAAAKHAKEFTVPTPAPRQIVNTPTGSTPKPDTLPQQTNNFSLINELCLKISGKLASVSTQSCQDQKMSPTGAISVEGHPIAIKEYPPSPKRSPQARVLLMGGIHGDEFSSIGIVFNWMQTLNQHHSGLFHWHVAPLVNPDGLFRTKSQRTNAHGVDLNRNFPTTNWLSDSRDYWINRTKSDPRRFPGPAPLSEPESHWVEDEINQFKPHAIISVHAPYGILDYDGERPDPPQHLGHLNLSPMGTYPGSLGRYAGVEKRIPIITIELSYAGIMPSENEIASMWMDLIRWLTNNIFDPDIYPNRSLSQPIYALPQPKAPKKP